MLGPGRVDWPVYIFKNQVQISNLKINHMARTSEFRNPLFWAAAAFIGGLVLAAWGWDKNDSTIAARTHGSVAMIVTGCVLAVAGLIYFFTGGNRKS
jgi:hypothetical protein